MPSGGEKFKNSQKLPGTGVLLPQKIVPNSNHPPIGEVGFLNSKGKSGVIWWPKLATYSSGGTTNPGN